MSINRSRAPRHREEQSDVYQSLFDWVAWLRMKDPTHTYRIEGLSIQQHLAGTWLHVDIRAIHNTQPTAPALPRKWKR